MSDTEREREMRERHRQTESRILMDIQREIISR